MFSKTLVSLLLLASAGLQVQGHAIIAPALGVTGTAVRSDVQNPSTAKPCGNIDPAKISTSTTAKANGDSVTLAVTDFNAGADGSRAIKTVTVDPTGTGNVKNFVAATIGKNGNAAPTTVGTDQVTINMPAGTKCTGGADGATCLLSLTTTAGFGNCVAVSQGSGSAAAGSSSVAKAASSSVAATKAASTSAAAAVTTSAAAAAETSCAPPSTVTVTVTAAASAATGNVAAVNSTASSSGMVADKKKHHKMMKDKTTRSMSAFAESMKAKRDFILRK